MGGYYPVDKPEPDVKAYDMQSKKEVELIDQLKTECDFTDYWLCKDFDENLLICNVDNLKDLHR